MLANKSEYASYCQCSSPLARTSQLVTFQCERTTGTRLVKRGKVRRDEKQRKLSAKDEKDKTVKGKESKNTPMRRLWRFNSTGCCCCWSTAVGGLQVMCWWRVQITVCVPDWEVFPQSAPWISTWGCIAVCICDCHSAWVCVCLYEYAVIGCCGGLDAPGLRHVSTCSLRNAANRSLHAKHVSDGDTKLWLMGYTHLFKV